MSELGRKTINGFVQLLVGLGVLLFIPAWTLDFWQAWVFLFVFVAPAALVTAYLWRKDRNLLERRIRSGPTAEKERSQQGIMFFVFAFFIILIVVPALDHRFHWSNVPNYVVIFGDVLIVLGYIVVFFVFRENTFTSSTIEVAEDQKVISTGLYALVRHPMYAGALVLLLGVPIALGSWWGLVGVVLMIPALVLEAPG